MELNAIRSTGRATKSKERKVAAAEKKVEYAQTIHIQASMIYDMQKQMAKANKTGRKSPAASAARPYRKQGYRSRRQIVTNQDEIDEYKQADAELFNILFLILTDAASYILRRIAPVNGSSGSGIQVWRAIEAKYQPADEHRRRQLERELDATTMKSGTDPDIFITRVWYLAEQINFIGGSITASKCADIILQGLPAEYDLIRYCDSAEGGYDLAKIESTARNMWYTRWESNVVHANKVRWGQQRTWRTPELCPRCGHDGHKFV